MMKLMGVNQLTQKAKKLRNLQSDVLALLEEYAKMSYNEHGYINPHIISQLLDVVSFNNDNFETSSELSDWYHSMWSQ